MPDSIASRVTRIISGSAHALLDAVEDAAPEAIMAQAIREVEQVIDEVRAELGKAEAGKYLVTTHLHKLNTEHEHLSTQVETALNHGREDLARSGVERQINIEDQIPVLQKSLAEQQERGEELASYMAALLAKNREMEQALQEFLAARATRARMPGRSDGAPTTQGRVDTASSAFDRILATHTGMVGLTSASTTDAAKVKELEDLLRAHRIEEKLARLKAARPGK